MDGKIMIRWLKVICVLAVLSVIFFYQGQTSPGCPGGSGLPPGCNPGSNPGGGGGGNPPASDCGSIQKDTECNSKADCGWYEPPPEQTANPSPTPNPPHCSKDKDKDRDENSCKSVVKQGCVWSNSKCITWQAFCESFKNKDNDESKCKQEEYENGKKICNWDKSKENPCFPNTPPEAYPVTKGQAVCLKIDAFCSNFADPSNGSAPKKCNDNETGGKCQWSESDRSCVPKTTTSDCSKKSTEAECNTTQGCVMSSGTCKTIQAYCDEADGAGENQCREKKKNNQEVCEWDKANNDCKPKAGTTRHPLCNRGDIIKPEFGNESATCPTNLTNVQCPCEECFQVTESQPPKDNNTSKGYGFVTTSENKIGVLCCNGLYYNKGIGIPAEENDPKKVRNDIATNFAIRYPNSPTTLVKTLEDAVKACRRIWNGVNIEVQTYYESSGSTKFVGANKYDRCGKGEGKNAVRCVDVKRQQPSDKTTKHIFCCEKEQYLNTFYIKKRKGGGVDKEATGLPYVWWENDGSRKLWVDNEGKEYTGLQSLNEDISDACQSCNINPNPSNPSAHSVIEKIYNFYRTKVFGITTDAEGIPNPDDPNMLLNVEKKEYYEYFYSDKENLDLSTPEKIANFLRVRVAGAPACVSEKEGASEVPHHYNCCWKNGSGDGCPTEACNGCKNKLVTNLLAQIKNKLEAICKNIQVAGDPQEKEEACAKKTSESDCKKKLYCKWESGGNCKPAELWVSNGSIEIEEQGQPNVKVPSNFFSSQRCGFDE